MEKDGAPNSHWLIFGRPFLKTTRTKIDVHHSTLSMELDSDVFKININDNMKFRKDYLSIYAIDATESLTEKKV